MRIFAFLNALTGVLCLEEMMKQGDEVVGVVTPPGEPEVPDWSVKNVADRHFLPVYQTQFKDVNTPLVFLVF